MNALHDFNHSILDLTPATLHQLVTVQAAALLSERLPEIVGLVRVTGILSDPGQARGQWHYGVRLADDGAQVQVDVPAALVAGNRLTAGEWVCVTGAIRVRTSRQGHLELRIEVGSVAQRGGSADAPPPGRSAHGNTAELLKTLRSARHPFPVPQGRPMVVALIQSSSVHAQVVEDCMGELEKLGRAVHVVPHRINILDPAAIAVAIERAETDLLMVIRGGGDAADFDVFDDPRVLKAMADKECYRVVGLGHSGNRTLLGHLVDFEARTPAQAGLHVREQVEANIRQYQAMREALANGSSQSAMTHGISGRFAWWAIAAAFAAGILLARLS